MMPTKDELAARVAELEAQLAEKVEALAHAPSSGDPLIENTGKQPLHIRFGDIAVRFPPGESRMDPEQYLAITEHDEQSVQDAWAKLIDSGVIKLRAAF